MHIKLARKWFKSLVHFPLLPNLGYAIKDTFSCGPINMKFAPHEICSVSIPKPTDRTEHTVKVIWEELRKS